MRLCARAEKSQDDARQLMRGWGLAEREGEQVLARLVRDRFIDDGRYAEAFVRDKLRLSGWGEYKIRTALQRKRIDRELIDAALAQADRQDMAGRLRQQLERKMRTTRHTTQYELKTKLIRYGLSLGYDYETVLRQRRRARDGHGDMRRILTLLLSRRSAPGRRASGSTPEITYIRSAASRGFTRPISAKCVPDTSTAA